MQLRLPAEPIAPVGGTRFKLTLESSRDLANWSPQGDLTSVDGGPPTLSLDRAADHQFFRLRTELESAGDTADGGDFFGYNRIFQEELRAVGFLTPAEFAEAHPPSPNFLPQISFDPTTSKFWDGFSADPAVINASLPANSGDKRLYDFRLNPAELAIFATNGFVVSERLGRSTFADIFYRVFADDLPVYVSADAILHAWHFSYQRLLEESEETQLAPALQEILDGMHQQLALVPEPVRNGPLKDSLNDADYFLTIGRSLASGARVSTAFGNEEPVTNTLQAIDALQFYTDFEMFGSKRIFDFSQFTVRGHYERSERLARYFRAFMWTARADLRILAAKPDRQTLREFGTAIVLSQMLQASGQATRWRDLDDLIRLFVGRTDAMTFAQLQPLLAAAGIPSLDSITSLDPLRELQARVLEEGLGSQLIAGEAYFSPFSPEQYQLPPSFVFTGQRFNPDGWALGKVIFDRIQWNEEIPRYTFLGKVIRRHTSALDMAYAVLQNRHIGSDIAQRMLDTQSRTNFRDGLPYAHNLTALARTFDRLPAAAWEESIYTRWLSALRELSKPELVNDTRFPEAMRTRAWAMRLLNTQLASYTELKHDTVLYAKQPYTGLISCEYPAGFVEPIPRFWRRMREMAETTATNLARLPVSGSFPIQDPSLGFTPPDVNLAQRQASRVDFCLYFALQMARLETMALRELAQEPFTTDETAFIRGLMNRQDHSYFGPTFDGWYPSLYYKDYGQLLPTGIDSNGSNKPDQLVTDVHTAPPDAVDGIGGVLHQATGNVDLLMIAVDNGPDHMVYAGPVLSHYEFIVPGPTLTRLTDSAWKAQFPQFPGQTLPPLPPRPDWTRSYLVPSQPASN